MSDSLLSRQAWDETALHRRAKNGILRLRGHAVEAFASRQVRVRSRKLDHLFQRGRHPERNQTLAERGVYFEEQLTFVANMDDYDLWLAAFRDSEHNLMAMMSNVAH